ncbi:MAG: hypothetical protein BGN94_08560 [Rhizobiales bacterium 68-8]|nr:MAG: hypothetical protein BGN94_08560 [Rhizobiales bacterium 68-8]
MNRAVTVIAEKKNRFAKGGSGRAAPAALKDLGEHPDGGKITVRDGRYGPYVNWGKVNATLPKGTDPQSIELDKALELIAAKAGSAKGGGRKAPARGAKKSAPKKAAGKKPAAKSKSGD